MYLKIKYQPNHDGTTGILTLVIGNLKNFHGELYLKRTNIYIKVYHILTGAAIQVILCHFILFYFSQFFEFDSQLLQIIEHKKNNISP